MTSPFSSRYQRLAARFDEIVTAVPIASWANPSPCTEWTALDVFHHVVTTQADLYGRMSFGSPIDLGLSSTYTYDELRTGWVQVRQIVQRTLDTPVEASLRYDGYFGATSFEETVDRFYSFDLVVHSWDIAVATHLHAYESIDAVEMANCLADFADLSATMRQPGLLGPELPVAANADEQTRFLAFLGRTAP